MTIAVNVDVVGGAEYVASNSKSVRVCETACKDVGMFLAKKMIRDNYTAQAWAKHTLNHKAKDKSTADWVFLIDSLNFSFWSERSENDRYTVEYQGSKYTGYWSLVAAVNRALDEGIPIINVEFWASKEFTPELLRQIFRSSTDEEIPLFDERYRLLKEIGAKFGENGWSSITDLLSIANGSSKRLLEILVSEVPGFSDISIYNQTPIPILKRAQILVGDLWAAFEGASYGHFEDIDGITMFADYRVPQMLQKLQCLQYSPELRRKIENHIELPHGCDDEIELRCCSIWAVQLMLKWAREINPIANAVLLDFFLWDAAKEAESKDELPVPVHRTRSIFY